jgi:hypothetical protein
MNSRSEKLIQAIL